MSEQKLSQIKVAILASDGFEQAELEKPRKALEEAGAKTVVIAIKFAKIQGYNHDEKGDKVAVDLTLDKANPEDFDAVLLPGGALNADFLRAEKKAQEFVTRLYKNVPVLDSGARGSTTTFAQRGIGDVLLSWENEAYLALNELGKDKVEVVTPSISILAEPPVSVVDKIAARHGTTEVAKAYLEFLYSEQGQEIAARNYYRPRLASVAAKYASRFSKLGLFTIDELFGGWQKAQKKHFDDGGVFDKIYTPGA